MSHMTIGVRLGSNSETKRFDSNWLDFQHGVFKLGQQFADCRMYSIAALSTLWYNSL